jgi:stearoyl-CoA desaturase (delta-9 desaturase)
MLAAVVANRFHVLKLYGNQVVKPVVVAESRYLTGEARRRLRRVRRLITRESAPLDAANTRRLTEALRTNAKVQTIYDFRQRLKALWTQQAKEQHELLGRLQAWCADAEQSGIAALEDFARQLRGYRAQLG